MIPAPGASPSYMPSAASGDELEERAARVEQRVDPVARQQLAALDVPLPGALTPAEGHPLQLGGQVGGQFGVRGGVAGGAVGVDRRGSGQHRSIHGQRLTPVHSDGPPHTPEWLTAVHFAASIHSVTSTHTERDAALHADAERPSRREQILQAAAQLFAERGSRAVGMDDIGAAVGVTGPAIYRHFAGKDAMLAEMLVRISERLLAGGSERVAGRRRRPGRPAARADRLPRRLRARQPRADHRAGPRPGTLPDAEAAQVRRLQRRYVEVWVTVLARLHPAADAATCRARAHAVFGLINSTPHSAGRLDRTAMAAPARRHGLGRRRPDAICGERRGTASARPWSASWSMSAELPLAFWSTQEVSTMVTVVPERALEYSALGAAREGLPVYRTPSRSRSLTFPLPLRSVSARRSRAVAASAIRTREIATTTGLPPTSVE